MTAIAAVPTTRPSLAVFGAAGFSVLIWSGTLVVTRVAVATIDGITIGILRTVVAALIVLPLLWWVPARGPRRAGEWGLLAIAALGGFVVFPVLFSLGLHYTVAAHGALIMAGLPAFTGLFLHMLERRWPSPRWWIGIALALGGEAFLIGSASGLTGGSVLGDVLMLGGCAAAASGYIAGSRLGQSIGSWSTTCFACLSGAALMLPALPFLLPRSGLFEAGIAGWSGILYLGLLATLLAYVTWYWALGRGGIARMAPLQFLQTPIAIVLAVVLLGEPLPPALLGAGICILGGVALAQRG